MGLWFFIKIAAPYYTHKEITLEYLLKLYLTFTWCYKTSTFTLSITSMDIRRIK